MNKATKKQLAFIVRNKLSFEKNLTSYEAWKIIHLFLEKQNKMRDIESKKYSSQPEIKAHWKLKDYAKKKGFVFDENISMTDLREMING